MSIRLTLCTLLGLLAGADASTHPASRTVKSSADRVVVRDLPIPTSTLVSDFQKDGVNASWAEGHPKLWNSEKLTFGEDPLFVDVSPDEKFVALAWGQNLTIRALDTLEVTATLETEFDADAVIAVITSSKDGGYNAFLGADNYNNNGQVITQVRLSSDGAITGETTQYQGKFSGLDGRKRPFSPDGRYILAINNRIDVAIYDLDNPGSSVTLKGHTDAIMSVAWSPDGTLVSTTAWDGFLKLWDSSTGKLVHTFPSTKFQNWQTNISPDGKYVVVTSAGRNAAVYIYSVSDFDAAPITISGFGDWIRAAAWSPDSRLLATASTGFIQIYSTEENKVVQRWEMEDRRSWEPADFLWIGTPESGLKLAYRTTAGLEVYDFEENLKYRWGPAADAQYDGGGSGDGTFLLKTKGLIGGSDADLVPRFYEFPY